MNFYTRWQTKREIEGNRLQMEATRVRTLRTLFEKKAKFVESWGSKDTDYELGWNNAIRSQMQATDNKTPLSLQVVVGQMIGTARDLYIKNPFAQSAVFNLQHYVVGKGFNYRKTGGTPEQSAAIAAYWQAWYSEENWYAVENEIVKRLVRDGEVLIQWFDDIPRFVEPNQLVQNTEAPWGIYFDPKDQATILAYNVAPLDQFGGAKTQDAKKVPADQIDYLRWPLVDLNAPRGMPPFYFYADHLNGAVRVLKNMRELTAIQTAIAVILKHPEGTTGTNIEQWAQQRADKTAVDPDSGKNVFQKKLNAGTMLETKPGQEIEFPAAGMNPANFIEVVAADLRAVAAGMALPEFIFSADAGRSNYASLMAAEGPAVKTFEALQEMIGQFLAKAFDRVMTKATSGGNADLKKKYAVQPLDKALLLLVTAVDGPSVRTRDFFTEARTFAIEAEAGVLSPQGWCAARNRDYQTVMTEIVDHLANYPGMPWPPTLAKQTATALVTDITTDPPQPEPTQTGNTASAANSKKTGSEKKVAQGK